MRSIWLVLLLSACVPYVPSPIRYAAEPLAPHNCGTPDQFKECVAPRSARSVRVRRELPIPWPKPPYTSIEELAILPDGISTIEIRPSASAD